MIEYPTELRISQCLWRSVRNSAMTLSSIFCLAAPGEDDVFQVLMPSSVYVEAETIQQGLILYVYGGSPGGHNMFQCV